MTSPSTKLLPTVLRHAAIAAATGLVIGALDGFASAHRGGHRPELGALFGGGLGALAGTVFGLVQGPIVHAGRRILERLGLLRRWRTMTSAARDADRGPVVAFHAWLVTLVLAGAMVVIAFSLLLERSTRIKEASLRDVVLVMAVAGASAAMTFAGAAVVPWVSRGLAAFDRRFGLPFPRWAWLRYALFVALPAGLVLLPLFAEYGPMLGILGPLFGVILFVVAEGLLWRLGRAIGGRLTASTRPRRITFAVLAAVLLAPAVFSAVAFARWAPAAAVAADGRVLPAAVELLQTVTDVDRDGISSLFGGNDCAPFDRARSPLATDVPGNGIDEDCDGRDLEAAQALPRLATYYGELPPSQQRRFNVLLLVVDSLRADHLSSLGYRHKTSPHMDELGKQGWMFTRAYSQSSTTALSMPSMLAGRRPSAMQWDTRRVDPAPTETMLPAVLARHGYDTTIAVNRYVQRHLRGLLRPFQHVATVPPGVDWQSGEYIISDIIVAAERARAAQKPFFITAHFDDVHHPYRAYQGRAVPTFSSKDRHVASYDRCIANFDNMLRSLTAHLKNIGIWDDTILILTADHGEEFEEHGGTIHSRTCYVESLHVPLIVRIPGTAPKRSDARVALTDLVPTLIEALGLPTEGFELDGQSLYIPALAPERVTPDRPLFCSVFQLLSGRKNFFIRSVRTDSHALIVEAMSDRAELYDIRADPREQDDIAADHAPLVEDLEATLKASLTGNLWEARKFK